MAKTEKDGRTMGRTEQAEFTNMCMLQREDGKMLFQRRRDPDWPGLVFPGGHVEPGETFVQSAVREVHEETGIIITGLRLCGLKHWEEDGVRNVVLLYRAEKHEGMARSSEEGEVWWMPLRDFPQAALASGMKDTLRVFLDDCLSEHSFRLEDGHWLDVME